MPQVKEEEEEVKVLQVKEEEEGLLIRQVKEEEEEGVEIPQVKDEEGEPRFPLVKTEEEAPGRPQIKDEEDIFTCEDRKPLTLKQETADFLQMQREEISDNNAVQLGELEAGRKQPIPRLATTAYTAKEPKQRKTVEEKKATKRLQDQKRSQHRINLGAAFTRWRALRDRLGITLDQQLAVLLLDSGCLFSPLLF
ncbi:cilia- and flagella-associated protein 251-like [Salarias fasciatus]|uniref:cilia- and flagella-associated protein 251-like n=1 Tax=Salarias fasciatus TaxID=181472 RepID=UPI001176CC3A|nr:cilia- and flagella-associated protein 251-like [Salarias fasciatus]